jgi:hypothetical protein
MIWRDDWTHSVWCKDRRGFGNSRCDCASNRTFLSDSVVLLFQVFPRPILGVILFFAGVELALVIKDIKLKKQNLFVLLITAGTAMWNMGVAYLAGLILYYGLQRRWVKL